jgi:phage baseplate assembly protein gpV
MPTQPASTQRDGASGQSQFDVLEFVFRQMSAKLRTSTIVKVVAVYNNGGVEPVGAVDVQPLVQQVDGIGNVTSLPVLYGLPYMRLQGGANAIILDPQVGDLGIAIFADRDTSAAAAAKDQAPPGSARRHSLSDGLYLGGILNGLPQQYVQFNAAGLALVSPTKISLTAPNVEIDASTQFKVVSPDIQEQGSVHVTGAQTNDSTIVAQGDVTGQGTSLHTHKHSGVTSGSSQTGAPA